MRSRRSILALAPGAAAGVGAAAMAAPSRRWFRRYDADQDGSITVDEIDSGRRPR